METKTGVLNGIGVGVGDPDMLTIKAVKCIKESDVICLPRKDKTKCRAYQIARAAVPEIEQKQIIGFDFAMITDKSILQKKHQEIYESVKEYLAEGKIISFLTIGDPTVYSTFASIAEQAQKDNVQVRIINGINSFCACAARLGISLCEGDSSLHVISDIEDLEMALSLSGTKIIMKCAGSLPAVKKCLLDLKYPVKVYAVADCGTAQEKVYYGIEEIPENSTYMMTIIVKE